MSLIGYDLSQYPLENHYKVCRQYIRQSIDWPEVSNTVREKGTICIDVSNTISLFPHLELYTDYCLVCYMASEYHGIWGRVAAIKKGEAREDKSGDTQEKWHPLFGKELNIPEYAVPPMEAIYNDGTPEGYFEAVLFSLFLNAIPYAHYEKNHWHIIEPSLPEDYENAWNARVSVTDWSPRCSERTLSVFRRVIENGLGSSNGRDRIYLTQYTFAKRIKEYLFCTNRDERAVAHILDDSRYTETRRCCVFSQTSVLVAEEKEYGTY